MDWFHSVSLWIFILSLDFAEASASTPVIKVMSNVSSRVVLQCESAGWYPEPELLWLDGEGNLLSAGPTETLRGPDDLYTVSSRVTVEKRHSNNITCRVQQRNTNQSRETHVHGVILDSFIPLLHIVIIVGIYCFLALSIVCFQSVETKTACRDYCYQLRQKGKHIQEQRNNQVIIRSA
ncbi:butyrophilin subfamily 2 member A2 isoform X2 [Oreochromis niloticus]|uniref:butyrophilin subfamily 2 member A2 isoform X2 n=1 Tax=Oreochromis niloticus TaxID=8128 RepID=UPI000DF3D4D4|nr:butyrophilin subfamily 2 member A2 isoform X2 [Oreochromis niloticus]